MVWEGLSDELMFILVKTIYLFGELMKSIADTGMRKYKDLRMGLFQGILGTVKKPCY